MVVPHTPSTPVSPVAACEGGRRGGGRGEGGGGRGESSGCTSRHSHCTRDFLLEVEDSRRSETVLNGQVLQFLPTGIVLITRKQVKYCSALV